MEKKDLTNVAYTDEYLTKREKWIAAVVRPENMTYKEEILSENGYNRTITEYAAVVDGLNLGCSHNKVYDAGGILIHEYTSLDDHRFFCTPVAHSNGRQYLAYKEDLYGYSVLDIESKETFRYIPAESWKDGGETFIVVDIFYNPINDIVAAEGCYWACPYGTFLFEVKDPMKQFTRYLDIYSIAGYDKYGTIDFQSWDGADILLKSTAGQKPPYKYETFKMTQMEYEQALRIV